MTPGYAIFEIKRLFGERHGIGQNPRALNRIQICCDSLRQQGGNPIRISEIETCAQQYFSNEIHDPDRYQNLALWASLACDDLSFNIPG